MRWLWFCWFDAFFQRVFNIWGTSGTRRDIKVGFSTETCWSGPVKSSQVRYLVLFLTFTDTKGVKISISMEPEALCPNLLSTHHPVSDSFMLSDSVAALQKSDIPPPKIDVCAVQANGSGCRQCECVCVCVSAHGLCPVKIGFFVYFWMFLGCVRHCPVSTPLTAPMNTYI